VELLLDVFGYLSVLLRGCVLTAQSVTIGGVAFLMLLAQPIGKQLGASGTGIVDRARRLLAWSAAALLVVELLTLAVQVAVLAGTLDLPTVQAVTTTFAAAVATISAGAVAIAVGAVRPGESVRGYVLVPAALLILSAQVATSHAAARVDARTATEVAGFVHMAAAAVWIGGLPYLLSAMARTADPLAWHLIGRRYSLMSMISVALLVCAGTAMAFDYIGSREALYGTAYGVMVVTKVLLLAGMLFLGWMNFRLVRHMTGNPAAAVLSLRRFVEAELGIGLTVLFAAGSLTSQPPGVDLTTDRASWSEVVHCITPSWPRLTSPAHETLAISRLDERIATAAARHEMAPRAFVPGEGLQAPRNAMDIAWSEFNHHWAGLLLLGMALLAVLERTPRTRWARHWPLGLVVLAVAIVARGDPEVWPMGKIGLVDSLRDPEVAQHRLFECLTAFIGVLEWRARGDSTGSGRLVLLFPLLCALGGALLLTHSHALANVKEQLLIEITHVPLALAVIVAAWSRWIQVRLDGPPARIAAWIWPVALVVASLSLLFYQEP
jgi:putative copper resistance protein D